MNNSDNKLSRAERESRRELAMREGYKKSARLLEANKTILVQPVDDYLTLERKAIVSDKKNSAKDKKRLDKLAIEREKQKKELVAQLRKTPIVQSACERTGIGRSTYYDWRKHDRTFARAADRSIEAGRFFMNDLAELKLLQQVQDGVLTAIIFWLKHNHPKYAVVNRIIHQYETVTDRPSVEEENVATQEISKMIARKMEKSFTTEEFRDQIEDDLEEAERNAKSDKRLESFEKEE